jgi:hypothetical protein
MADIFLFLVGFTHYCTVQKNFKVIFSTFFFSNSHKVIPYTVSKLKKQKIYSMYVLNKIKNVFLHQNYLGTLKLSKLKVLKIFRFFSVQCTGCVTQWSAEISCRSENIQTLLKISENEHRSTVTLELKG